MDEKQIVGSLKDIDQNLDFVVNDFENFLNQKDSCEFNAGVSFGKGITQLYSVRYELSCLISDIQRSEPKKE